MLQIAALFNVGIVVYFGNPGSDQTALEWMLTVFPLLFGIEFIVRAATHGFCLALYNPQNPELQTSSRLAALMISIGLFGATLLVADKDRTVMSAQNARTLASF